MRKLLFPALALVLTAQAARAEVPQTTQYTGTLNGTIAITMSLTSDYHKVEGTYVYSLYGKDLGMVGTRTNELAPKIDYTLKEETGTFTLATEKSGRLAGAWTSADGKKVLPVALTPVARAYTIVSARTDAYQVKTGYLEFIPKSPFFTALNLQLRNTNLTSHNKNLLEFAAQADRIRADETVPWESEQTPLLMFQSDTLVSIRSFSYSYTGGAHGNWGYGGDNYAWINNKIVELKPESIIAKDKWPALQELCIKHLKEQGASSPQDIATDKNWTPNLVFTGQGLLVFFNPYEVGSYAEGARIVTLPWKESKPLLAAGSPVAALLPK